MISRRRLLTVGLLTLAAAGCSRKDEPPEPRPLTNAEAERLAVIRFNSFNDRTRALDAHIVGTPSPLRLHGWVDYRASVGYMMIMTAASPPEALGVVHWNPQVRASRPAPLPNPPLPAPKDGWVTSALDHNTSVFDAALAMILQLGADRPENPLLLAQSDARWIRADRIGDTPVDVVSGPTGQGAPAGSGARLRYWIDMTGHLLRMEAIIGQGSAWSTFDFSVASGITVPGLKQ